MNKTLYFICCILPMSLLALIVDVILRVFEGIVGIPMIFVKIAYDMYKWWKDVILEDFKATTDEEEV